MKGATALPCVRMISPPNSASITRIGTSQYFFRTRTKAQSSETNDIMTTEPRGSDPGASVGSHEANGGSCVARGPSERPGQGVGGRAGRPPLDPVALARPVQPQAEQVLARESHEEPDRRDHPVEHQAHDHRAHDPVEQETESQPETVQRGE